jgi:hypothetical protein
VVYTVITIVIPIKISETSSAMLQSAMASVVGVQPGYVLVASVSQPAAATPRLVTANVASADADAAGRIAQRIVPDAIVSGLALNGFPNASFVSVGVTGCVPGYELISSVCKPCMPGYYCVGGSAPSQGCGVVAYSFSSANSSASCWTADFILVVATMSTQDLSKDVMKIADKLFLSALISAAGVPGDTIKLNFRLGASERRSHASFMRYLSRRFSLAQIRFGIAVIPDTGPAIADRIKSDINQQLKLQGLPSITIVSIVVTGTGATAGGTSSVVLIASVVSACCVTVCLVGCCLWARAKAEAEEERVLRIKIEELRVQLGITLREGFVLNTETGTAFVRSCAPRARNLAEMTVVRRSYLEAAARLALLEVCLSFLLENST